MALQKDDPHMQEDEDMDSVSGLADGDIDYAYTGQNVADKGLGRFTVPALVLLVAAGIGGGVMVSARLPGVRTALVSPPPAAPVKVASVSEIIAPPVAATHVDALQNIPRLPDMGDDDLTAGMQQALDAEPAAGTPSENSAALTAQPQSGTTASTMPSSQTVTEVPAQPPAMPPVGAGQATTAAASTSGGTAAAQPAASKTADAPALTAPDENLPAVGGSAATSAGSAQAGSEASASETGAASGTADAPGAPKVAKPDGPDAYYDASAPPPPGMANAVGPRKVNPVQEPGSKFIIVEKDSGPQGTDAQIVAANRAIKLGHYDAAADMFDALYAKNPRDPRILMGRAVALQNTGRFESALRTYDQLLNIDHNNPDALMNMLGILRKQYPEVALRRLMNLHNKYPDNAMITAQIGVTEADNGQLDDAIRYLGMAISMEPNNAQHQFNLAVVEDRAGKKDEAIKYYQQALETDAVYGESRSVPRDKIYDRLSTLREQ